MKDRLICPDCARDSAAQILVWHCLSDVFYCLACSRKRRELCPIEEEIAKTTKKDGRGRTKKGRKANLFTQGND